jgi:excisionase family DNA binding protein
MLVAEWIGMAAAMDILGVGATTIKRWADEGRLPHIRTLGGHRRFNRSVVESLVVVDSAAVPARRPGKMNKSDNN